MGKEAGTVDYVTFCKEVERIFQTHHMEKDPLLEHHQWRPEQGNEASAVANGGSGDAQLSAEEEALCNHALERLAAAVKQRRVQLATFQLEDFDRQHSNAVSQSQFRRALGQLGVSSSGGGLSEAEWAVLFKRFRAAVGGRDDVNFLRFLQTVQKTADAIELP